MVATGANVGVTRATLASKAKTTSHEPASKEPTGTKRKREALLEVTTKVTNHRNLAAGGSTTSKTEGKQSVAAAGAKIKTNVKPPLGRTGRLPSSVAVGKRERLVRAGSESATSTKTDAESISTFESKTSIDRSGSEVADERMEVDEPQAKLARVPEGDEEVERISKRRHTDDERVEDSQAEADKIAADLQATELSPIQLWDDLDAGDWDDPLMVSEYVTEVCDYLKEIEVRWFPFVHLVEFLQQSLTRWPLCRGPII